MDYRVWSSFDHKLRVQKFQKDAKKVKPDEAERLKMVFNNNPLFAI